MKAPTTARWDMHCTSTDRAKLRSQSMHRLADQSCMGRVCVKRLMIVLPINAAVVTVVNGSVWTSGDEASQWAAAINRQVQEQVGPAWNLTATVNFANSADPAAWVCRLYDGDPQSTALGSHDLSAVGVPECQVNVPAAQYFGVPVSVVLSREIVDMVVNPWLDGIVLSPFNLGPNSAVAYLRESADPVGGLTYSIDGVSVSDFTFPQFWQNAPSWGAPLDFLHRATSQLQPIGGGFLKARWITPFGGINSLTDWFPVGGGFCLGC